MAPQKPKSDQKPGGKLHRLSVAIKKEIVEKHYKGVRVKDLAKQYGLAKSTISTYLKHKDKIKDADVAKGMVGITAINRPQVLEKVEQLLMVWITDMQLKVTNTLLQNRHFLVLGGGLEPIIISSIGIHVF